jgi:hypothetical protein
MWPPLYFALSSWLFDSDLIFEFTQQLVTNPFYFSDIINRLE